MMNMFSNKWFLGLLLTTAYSLYVLSIVGCSDGSYGEPIITVDCGSGWVWDGTVCSRRTDGFNGSIYSITPALDGSNDLYAAGAFTHFKNEAVNDIVRLNNNGSLDREFVSNANFYTLQVVVPANDGSDKVYVGGYLSYHGPTLPTHGIARLDLDGTTDRSFDTGTGIGLDVQWIVPAIDGSGDVYVGGSPVGDLGATFESWLIRLNGDGSHDTDFNSYFKIGGSIISLATDGSGDLYISINIAPYIVRLNDDGSIDTSFDTGPIGFGNISSGFKPWITAIKATDDGSGDVYVAGYFNEYNNISASGLVRLNSDGSLDSEFIADNKVFNFQAGHVIVPALDGGGDIYVTHTDGQNIVRLNDDGTIDAGFGISSEGFDNDGRLSTISDASIAIDGSGDIYVAGSFTHYNLTPVANLARFTSSGVLVK